MAERGRCSLIVSVSRTSGTLSPMVLKAPNGVVLFLYLLVRPKLLVLLFQGRVEVLHLLSGCSEAKTETATVITP